MNAGVPAGADCDSAQNRRELGNESHFNPFCGLFNPTEIWAELESAVIG
jgi:hypothetical protein